MNGRRHRSPFLAIVIGLSGLSLGGITAAQVSPLHPETMPRVTPGPPLTYGTSQTSYVTVSEMEFAPLDSPTTYGDIGDGGNNLQRYRTAGAGFVAAVHLPSGAVLWNVEFDLCDSSTVDNHWQAVVFSSAKLDGLVSGVGTIITSVSNGGGNPCAAYTQDLSGLNYVIDNTGSRVGLLVVPQATDSTNSIAGAVIGYRLQVSPPPATADFADVPTSHPFFQFVEALYHSGITAGCGSGNFCPDSPLTRGQMAVFLAKALGLQFP